MAIGNQKYKGKSVLLLGTRSGWSRWRSAVSLRKQIKLSPAQINFQNSKGVWATPKIEGSRISKDSKTNIIIYSITLEALIRTDPTVYLLDPTRQKNYNIECLPWRFLIIANSIQTYCL